MNILNDDRKENHSIHAYTVKNVFLSIVLHLTLLIILHYYSLTPNKNTNSEGNIGIKAIMVDLSQIVSPEQSLSENSLVMKKTEKNKENENLKTEDLTVEQNTVSVKKGDLDPLAKKETKQIKQQDPSVKQEIKTQKFAKQSAAPEISDAQKFSQLPTPIIRNYPNYPRRAIEMKIEGYVRVIFDINHNGEVENIRIVESFPSSIFEREVKQAMRKWKYQKLAQKNIEIKIEFNLNKPINLKG